MVLRGCTRRIGRRYRLGLPSLCGRPRRHGHLVVAHGHLDCQFQARPALLLQLRANLLFAPVEFLFVNAVGRVRFE
jgi:hypothetical protein